MTFLMLIASSGVCADASMRRYEAISGRFAVSNNLPVKQPVRYPYLSLEEFHFLKPRPVIEARSCIYTC